MVLKILIHSILVH